ncbi:hypothetical protein PG996_001766 [Apiospora saccharicola]|uniref:Uncharacterized protein n=1 Tax=Apiospora saccharicola TaxID=335842 RepID=A0ABR1WKG6_9PEZI
MLRILLDTPQRSSESRSGDLVDDRLVRYAQLRARRNSLSDEAIAACRGRSPLPPPSPPPSPSPSLLALPPDPPIAEPRRIDTHTATLPALEDRLVREVSLQQTPSKQHDEARVVERSVTPEPPVATDCYRPRSPLQSRPPPQPRHRPRPRPRPAAIYVDSPVGIHEIPVVIHQFPVVVRDVPVLLTPDVGTPRAQSPKPKSLREPVKKFFKKAVAPSRQKVRSPGDLSTATMHD